MKNRKQLLADFYLDLLALPHDRFRATNQQLYAIVRDALANELDCDSQTIQDIFERMAAEDRK